MTQKEASEVLQKLRQIEKKQKAIEHMLKFAMKEIEGMVTDDDKSGT